MAQAKKTNVPRQLQKEARKAEKEYKEIYGDGSDKPQEPAATAPQPAQEAQEEKPQTAEVVDHPAAEKPAKEPPQKEKPVDWEQKYKTLDGKYNAEVPRLQRENTELMGRITAFEQRMADMEASAKKPEETPQEHIERLLKDEEIADYGEDMISVVKRAAREEISPELTKLREENEKLRGELGKVETNIATNKQVSMFEQMDKDLPTWRELNTNPEFLDWLAKPDVYSGLTRQELLTKAFEAKDTARVLRFFQGFVNEQTPAQEEKTGAQQEETPSQLDTLVAPGRSKSSTETSGARSEHIWTEASIAAYYRDVQKGAFKGREKERDALERDIFKAMQEGRIVG